MHPAEVAWVVLAGLLFLYFLDKLRRMCNYKARQIASTPTTGNPNDAVVFYTIPAMGTSVVPNSPFVGKLLTFLRMTGIPHRVERANLKDAPKGKIPYIQHNGVYIGDSQLIMTYLSNTFLSNDAWKSGEAGSAVQMPSQAFTPWTNLSVEAKGMSTAVMRIVEDHMYWGLVYVRWVRDDGTEESLRNWDYQRNAILSGPNAMIQAPGCCRRGIGNIIRNAVAKQTFTVGISRHAYSEISEMLFRDLLALSVLLGSKQYFTGDFPTDCDCAAFSMLDNIMFAPHEWELKRLLSRDPQFENLRRFTHQIRRTYFAGELQLLDTKMTSTETW